ncbi:MAG: LysR family transcriptional regulator [Myxococcota bacterium]
MDRLQAMAVFRAVIEERGFGRAAGRLGLSPASVSRTIADLERHLTTRLLHRTTRSLHATAEGRAYYERCVAILDQVDETEASLRQAGEVPTGTLRVTTSPAFGVLRVAPLLPAYHANFPNVRVDLFLDERVVDVVREGFDLALRIWGGPLPDSTLTARRLARFEEWFVASPAYLAARGHPRHPSDLARHDMIVWSRGSGPETRVVYGADGRHEVRLDGPLRTDSSLLQRHAALSGTGITILQDYVVADDLRTGALQLVLPGYWLEPFELWAVWPPAATLVARVRSFVDHVAAGLVTEGTANPPG